MVVVELIVIGLVLLVGSWVIVEMVVGVFRQVDKGAVVW
jgi:hypothetical protein